MPAPDDLAAQLVLGDALAPSAAPDEPVRRARASSDVSVVVVGAVVAQDRALLARALHLASTVVERQLVAIALAHLDGDRVRVDDLARDHLSDHPDSVLVAWIRARPAGPSGAGPRPCSVRVSPSHQRPTSGGHHAPDPS